MRRLYTKSTAVPGAQRVMDEFGAPVFTKKGRAVWEMPRPTSIMMHDGVVRVGAKTKRLKVEVPVYRGFDASLVRDVKASIRRKNRKDAEEFAKNPHASAKVEIPDDLIEGEE